MYERGEIDIAVITRFDIDVPPGELREKLAALPPLQTPRIATVFTLGYSALDCADELADEESARESDQLMELLFPGADPSNPRHRNRIADVGHLIGHKGTSKNSPFSGVVDLESG